MTSRKRKVGTVGREGRYSEAFLIHESQRQAVQDQDHYAARRHPSKPMAVSPIGIRLWEKEDFVPRPDDLLQERLYCIQWMRRKPGTKQFDYDFRAVTEADLDRERTVERYVAEHLGQWQANGWVPDMRVEIGGPPRYQGRDLVRSRGWTHWQHLFNARQLLLGGLINRYSDVRLKFGLAQVLNSNSRISRWQQ